MTDDTDHDPRERDLVAEIEAAGVRLLSRDVLEQPIRMRRLAGDGEPTTPYHVLISEAPLLPWARTDERPSPP